MLLEIVAIRNYCYKQISGRYTGMKEIYTTILKLKYFCTCNENKISSSWNISLAELKGVNAMESHESLTCSELAEKMNLSPSRGSRIIDNLVRKGYLFREIQDQDRRTTFLSLTKRGEKLKYNITREQKAFEDILTSKLNSQEIESVKKGLAILEKVLNQSKKEIKNS